MFDSKRVAELEEKLRNSTPNSEVTDLKATHRREVEKLEHEHELAIKTKEFEMKNFKDSEILEKNKKIEELTNSNAVLTKENEMMKQMVDINADIVDVKDIINKLIEKMPEIKLTSLNVGGGKSGGKQE